MTTTILPTRNEPWGFWGTISRSETSPAVDPTEAWENASPRIAEVTDASPEGVRDFLDSRHGRHFADEVANSLCTGAPLAAAIDAAIARWMGWRIDRRTSRDEGIPRGLPYLTGWVAQFQVLDEMQASPAVFRHQRRAPSGCAARGRSRPGMVPGPRTERTTR